VRQLETIEKDLLLQTLIESTYGISQLLIFGSFTKNRVKFLSNLEENIRLLHKIKNTVSLDELESELN